MQIPCLAVLAFAPTMPARKMAMDEGYFLVGYTGLLLTFCVDT